MIAPSAFCGLFGLRPQLNNPRTDGILPANLRQDTAGPLAKRIDDLVLTYSVMINDSSLFDNYQVKAEPNSLKIRVMSNFFQSFVLPTPFGNASYNLNSLVREELLKSLNFLGNIIQVNVSSFTFNSSDLDQVSAALLPILFNMAPCRLACTKSYMNKYFSDTSVFQSDAPYHSYNDLATSPILSKYWKPIFNSSNVNNPDQTCNETCKDYDAARVLFTNLVNSWLDGFDALAIPSEIDLPYFHNATSGSFDIPSFIYLASYTGNPALSIPAGYIYPSDSLAKDGFPVGLLLVSRPITLINAFKIAKLYETHKVLTKLPSLTPLIGSSSSSRPYPTLSIVNLITWLKKIFF